MAKTAAAALTDGGFTVRWLCAVEQDGELPPVPDGVELTAIPGRNASFRQVAGQSVNTAMELELARSLRRRPAAVVHDIGFGSPGSSGALWIAARMGAVCVATVRAVEVLCHRQTLRDWRDVECTDHADPRRCATCCLHSFPGGLSPVGAGLGRALRFLGACSPFPNELAFRNRLDLVVEGLGSAGLVLVVSDAEAEQLTNAGVEPRLFRSGDFGITHGAPLLESYARLLGG